MFVKIYQRRKTVMVIRMSKELHVRKSIRLKGYDYSTIGCYFVTICVKDRHEMLDSIGVVTNCVRPRLSEYGHTVEKIAILESTRVHMMRVT